MKTTKIEKIEYSNEEMHKLLNIPKDKKIVFITYQHHNNELVMEITLEVY